MAGGSNGYRAALVGRQLTQGLISSSRGTAGSPPFISFSTSYPEQNSDLSQIKTFGGGSTDRTGRDLEQSLPCRAVLFCQRVGSHQRLVDLFRSARNLAARGAGASCRIQSCPVGIDPKIAPQIRNAKEVPEPFGDSRSATSPYSLLHSLTVASTIVWKEL